MQIPLQITFRNMEPSAALETKIREKAGKLERYADQITRCHVVIEAPHQHQHQGKLFSVKIDITLPNKEILVTRHPQQHHAHEDIYVALRDAFDAARRQLEDYVRVRRGDVKTHETLAHGKIAQLFPDEDYGMIASADSREIYFHRHSVFNEDFDKLTAGTRVHYNEERGERGPQASTVYIEGKHHVV
jgi:ribosomal subunit interface protein